MLASGGRFFQILPMLPVHQHVHTYTVTTQTVELCQSSSTSGNAAPPTSFKWLRLAMLTAKMIIVSI